MVGIVLISHGEMAKGMANSATLFFGDDIPQLEYCCLCAEDAPDDFGVKIEEAIAKADTGDGVLLLADLFGGTPCNQAMTRLGEKVDCIAGANFPLFLELLNSREDGLNLEELVETGKNGVVDVKVLLQAVDDDDED